MREWMRLMRDGVVALAMVLLVASCVSSEIERNNHGISQLRKGMTREEVVVMLGQPLTEEIYHEPDVWHYYTRRRWADGSITRDECTPVVFEHDRVVGWGNDFLKQHRHEQW